MLKNKFEQHNLYQRGGDTQMSMWFCRGVAKCPCLSTRGEGGVKNGPKSVYVVYGSPLKNKNYDILFFSLFFKRFFLKLVLLQGLIFHVKALIANGSLAFLFRMAKWYKSLVYQSVFVGESIGWLASIIS